MKALLHENRTDRKSVTAILSALLGVALLALGGCATQGGATKGLDAAKWQSDLSQQYFRVGKTYADAGRWKDAIDQYSLALASLDAARAICKRNSRSCELKTDQYASNRAKILARRALANIGYKQMDRALADAVDAVAADPQLASGHYVLGGLYLMNGDFDKAAAELKSLQPLDASLAKTLAAQMPARSGTTATP